MSINYSLAAKNARMNAVCQMLAGGSLELLADGHLIARIPLPAPCGGVDGDTLTCSPEQGTYAIAKGTVNAARICNSAGEPIITGLTVGRGNAEVKLDYVALEPRQIVTITSMAIKHS